MQILGSIFQGKQSVLCKISCLLLDLFFSPEERDYMVNSQQTILFYIPGDNLFILAYTLEYLLFKCPLYTKYIRQRRGIFNFSP
jgi:hypothetical protein